MKGKIPQLIIYFVRMQQLFMPSDMLTYLLNISSGSLIEKFRQLGVKPEDGMKQLNFNFPNYKFQFRQVQFFLFRKDQISVCKVQIFVSPPFALQSTNKPLETSLQVALLKL